MHPGDGRVVPNFVIQALRNEDITVYGDGSQTRSFCYVDDLVDGLMRLMETPDEVTGPVNLGNPVEFTVRQLAEMVIDLVGSRSKIVYRPLPEDDPRQRCPDIRLAQKMLRLQPRVQLREGLLKTIDYFEQLFGADQKSAHPSLGRSKRTADRIEKRYSGGLEARSGGS
jgi:UDP-glucuronate decarboxylase